MRREDVIMMVVIIMFATGKWGFFFKKSTPKTIHEQNLTWIKITPQVNMASVNERTESYTTGIS